MIFNMWWGVGFFDFEFHKLAKVRGQEVTYRTKFINRHFIIWCIITIYAAVTVGLRAKEKVGVVKLEKLDASNLQSFTFNVS